MILYMGYFCYYYVKCGQGKMRNKALVIDDEKVVNKWYEEYASEDFEIAVDCSGKSRSLDIGLAIEKLQTIPYGLILMDNDLGSAANRFQRDDEEERHFNGKKLIEFVKEGKFGDINLETPFISISSQRELAFPRGYVEEVWAPKPTLLDKPPFTNYLERLDLLRERYLS